MFIKTSKRPCQVFYRRLKRFMGPRERDIARQRERGKRDEKGESESERERERERWDE